MNSKIVEKSILVICIIVIAIFAIGTAAIPAVISAKYGWGWLLIYPIALLFICGKAKQKKN